jgi:hypothetical protein
MRRNTAQTTLNKPKGVFFMTKANTRKWARGLGIGLVAAGAATAIGSAIAATNGQRKVKRKASQFARTVGDIVDNVQAMVH